MGAPQVLIPVGRQLIAVEVDISCNWPQDSFVSNLGAKREDSDDSPHVVRADDPGRGRGRANVCGRLLSRLIHAARMAVGLSR